MPRRSTRALAELLEKSYPQCFCNERPTFYTSCPRLRRHFAIKGRSLITSETGAHFKNGGGFHWFNSQNFNRPGHWVLSVKKSARLWTSPGVWDMERLKTIRGRGRVLLDGKVIPGSVGYSIELVRLDSGQEIVRGLASTTSDALRLASRSISAKLQLADGRLAEFRIDYYDDSTSSLAFEGTVPGLYDGTPPRNT